MTSSTGTDLPEPRCASCDHGRSHHPYDGSGGCWFSPLVSRPDVPIGCACREFIEPRRWDALDADHR